MWEQPSDRDAVREAACFVVSVQTEDTWVGVGQRSTVRWDGGGDRLALSSTPGGRGGGRRGFVEAQRRGAAAARP
jgi:hypothetical protein